MPEGPEVTTIVNGLRALLNSVEIIDWKFQDKTRYATKAPDGYNNFMVDIHNPTVSVKVIEVLNKGKFIYWKFSNGWVLFQTLGMSGGWYNKPKLHTVCIVKYIPIANTRSIKTDIKTDSRSSKNGDKNIYINKKIYFNDQRRFGTFKWIPPNIAKQELDKKLKDIGPDMLNEPPTLDEFRDILRRNKNNNKTINRIITDQKQISGVGNYLRSEILYAAKISPYRLIELLTDSDIKNIYNSTIDKIRASYITGGASIQNYSNIDNSKGTFAFSMEVYKKKHDPKGRVVKVEKIAGDGQSTHWVPSYQV